MRYSVGFTGTRAGMSPRQKAAFKMLMYSMLESFHHGDCVGADMEAANLCIEQEIYTVAHPCILLEQRAYTKSDRVLEPKAPLVRNKDIVDMVELMIACPRTMKEEQRSGTWATIRYARSVGRPLIILEP